MNATGSPPPNGSFTLLRRFLRDRARAERCELCGAEVAPEHEHLVVPSNRQLLCACQPCAMLFSAKGGEGGTKYRRVPRRIRFLADFRLTEAQWDSLRLPINLAFFFYSTPAGKVVALYPSPAGPTESLLSLEAWDEIVGSNPLLKHMEPDAEALLVDRVGREGSSYYLAPIDECYKLVGLIRAHWRGLSGGALVWEEIAKFFAELKRRAEPVKESANA
jgi:hypothetical protein